jgi:hypothetical protein
LVAFLASAQLRKSKVKKCSIKRLAVIAGTVTAGWVLALYHPQLVAQIIEQQLPELERVAQHAIDTAEEGVRLICFAFGEYQRSIGQVPLDCNPKKEAVSDAGARRVER